MIIDLTATGEVQKRIDALKRGEYDADLKLALNRARRLRRWVGRNDPSEEVRAHELERAERGFNHFAGSDVMVDARLRAAKTHVERLDICYSILDASRREIDAYVGAVKERFDAGPVAVPAAVPAPLQAPVAAPIQAPAPAKVEKRRPSLADRAFVGAVQYFITSPDDIVRIIQDGRGTIEMNALSLYEAGEILGALKDHFYLDRKNGKDLLISVAGHAPLPWFGENDSIESAVIAARGSKQTSREFESIRRSFTRDLHRYDVR
ncbi:MAG TPA: hypothetical protein VK147_06125 [Candidatus Didemnitutus sp.]|nr:hypothetical protein [Candidatus Didemnitutus sp.]